MKFTIGTPVQTTREKILSDGSALPKGSKGIIVEVKDELQLYIVDFNSSGKLGVWLEEDDVEKVSD